MTLGDPLSGSPCVGRPLWGDVLAASTWLRGTSPRRVLVLPLTAAVILGGSLPLCSMVEARAAADSVVSATVVLRTSVSAEALARTSALPRAARLLRLSQATPAAASTAEVAGAARTLGLTVDDTTQWSLAVHGPAEMVHRLSTDPAVSQVLVSGGPAARPADAARPLWGSQLHAAYQASAAAPP